MRNGRWRYISGMIFGIVFGAALVVVVNSTIDAQGLFSSLTTEARRKAEQYADALRSSAVPLDSPKFSNLVKLALAKRTNEDCYIIGSSHIMMMDQSNLPFVGKLCHEAINLGVAGAGYQDLILFLGLLNRKPEKKTIFLEFPPWVFRNDAEGRYQMLNDEYLKSRAVFHLPGGADFFSHWSFGLNSARFSVRYLEFNLRSAWNNRGLERDRNARNQTQSPDRETNNIHRDKMYSSGRLYPPRTPMKWEDVPVAGFRAKMPAVDSVTLKELRTVIGQVIAKGNVLHILMTPYHPKVWECEDTTTCKAFEASEVEILKIAADFGLTVFGSFNPSRLDATGEDFSDQHHLLSESAWKIENLIQQFSRPQAPKG